MTRAALLADPYLGRPSLPALAGEVQVAFARAARAHAERSGGVSSLQSLRGLLEREFLQELLLEPESEMSVLPSLPPETSEWFRREWAPRDHDERDHMTASAVAFLSVPYLRREAEEALGVKRTLPLPVRVLAIVGSLLAAFAATAAVAGVYSAITPRAPIVAQILLVAPTIVIAGLPAALWATSLGLYDLRAGRAGRYAVPALLFVGLCLWFAVRADLLPLPVWTST